MNDDARDILTRLAAPTVRALGLEIWGVEIIRSGRTAVRVFVEPPLRPEDAAEGALSQAAEAARGPRTGDGGDGGDDMAALSATVGQCEEISRRLGLALDVEDVFPEPYVLEVSTPGFARVFFSPEQMRPYVGDMIEARMPAGFRPEGSETARRVWRGMLRSVDGDGFVLTPAAVDEMGGAVPEGLADVRIPWEEARRVSRMYVFPRPAKPGGRPARKTERADDAAARPARKKGKKSSGQRGKGGGNAKNEALDGLDI